MNERNKFYTNSLNMTFKKIPAGSFIMGELNQEGHIWARPQHLVTISRPFYMQTTEVTQGQWRAVMGYNPAWFIHCGETCPVEQVSWKDIEAFIAALNARGEGRYRLPTEAEWEYAARAGSATSFFFGSVVTHLDK
ncbi:MAG: formylglycine-generating enzyme family protein [Magnetococcales bacterium]|nr:formylglycine-generating enzyme family protein [Magnetococcales bacterium]